MNNKFNFYSVYLKDLNKLNPFQFKKVINAISDYSKDGKLPDKLSAKGSMVFSKIMIVVDTEKQMEKELEIKRKAGSKGGQNRWNKQNYSKNKQNHSKSIAKKDGE